MPTSDTSTKPTDSAAVDAYMQSLKHPLAELAAAVRAAILAADPTIGEEIKWNAPAFFYAGAMAAFDAKTHARHLVVFNFQRKDALRLVFLHGDRANDRSGFLEGDYADGRRIATLSSLEELARREKVLARVLKAQLKHLK